MNQSEGNCASDEGQLAPGRYSSAPFDVCCPKCGSLIGEPCRALTSGRVTDIHETRFAASWKSRYGGAR